MSTPLEDDGILLAQADAANIHQLYDRYAAVLYGAALRMSGNEEQACTILKAVFRSIRDPEQRYRSDQGRPLLWLMARVHAMACLILEGERTGSAVQADQDPLHTPSDRSLHLRLRAFNLPFESNAKAGAATRPTEQQQMDDLQAIERALHR